jgi:catalase
MTDSRPDDDRGPETDFSERIVDTMNAIHGTHPGFRAVHAKGQCCKGSFAATAEAAALCRAAHFQEEEVTVTVRFSNGSGRPSRADGARDERGMAIKFHLPDGTTTDIVSLTLPVFFVRTPEDFFVFLQTQVPDPETGKPDFVKIEAFINDHPETQTAVGFAAFSMAPASFANCTFHGIHAFRLTGTDGAQRFARYRWVPDAGPATLTDQETRELGRDYLRDDLVRRLDESSIGYELQLQLADDEDDPTDPTVAWPEERTVVPAGRLTVDEFIGDDCHKMIFDPGRVIEGIEKSDDSILHARSGAYSVSFDRRTNL